MAVRNPLVLVDGQISELPVGDTVNGSVTTDLSSPPSIGDVAPNTVNTTQLISTGGVLAESTYTGPYTDGLLIDHITGNGRITVGGQDGIQFYNAGPNGNLLGQVTDLGNWDFNGNITVGTGTVIGGATNPLGEFTGNTNQYVQAYVVNNSSGTSASADFSVYSNTGTDSSGWADFGITSSGYADPIYTVTGPGEGYVLMSATPALSQTGNLVFATDSGGTDNAFQWYVGGFTQAKSAYKMQLNGTELLVKQPIKANGLVESTTGGFKFPDGTTQTTAAGTGSGDMTKSTYDTNNDGIVDAAASVPWSGVTGKPTFATVATSGSYADLSGKPTLATVATSGSYTDLTGTPTFKTIDGTSITGTGDYSVLPSVAAVTGDIMGIVDRTAATLSFNDATRTFTVTPVSGSWTFYYQGVLKTVSAAKSIQIANTDGARWIKIDPNTLELVEFTGSPGFDINVNVAYIYWDISNAHALIVGDERHGSKRDTTWHNVTHSNVGTVWRSGGGLTYTLNNDAAVTLGVGAPIVIQDEDLTHTITHSATPNGFYQQILETAGSLEVMYLDGTTYNSTTASTTPWIAGTSLAAYNYNNGTTWSLADAPEGSYISYWLLATNDIRVPVKLVLGRATHASIEAAYTEEFVEYGLSFAEQVFMYQVVVKTSSAYTGNTAKIQIAGIRKILAKSATSASATVAATNHNDLTGRSADDAHTISSITGLQTTLTSISPLTTKGDLYTRTTSANARLPIGADNLYLAADSTSATGLAWKSILTDPIVYTAASLTLTNGVYVSGSVTDIQTLNDGNFYQITDGTLAGPAWIITCTFNNVQSFNRIVANVDYTLASGHTVYFQVYNNSTLAWDNFGVYSGSTGYSQYAIAVLDYSSYISSGTVQARLYHSNTGNAAHVTKLDYFALEQSTQGSQGPKGSTGSTGLTGAGVPVGGATGQALLKTSATDYATAWADIVSSVGGTGTVNGLTLTGTVTTTGNLTLGGTLDLSVPPVIGGTTPAAITGTAITATASITAPSSKGAYSYGTLTYSTAANLFASYQTSVNAYSQLIVQNSSSGTGASSDIIVNNNLSTDTTYYGDFGMNSSTWTGVLGTASLLAPNVTYLTSTSSDLVIGTTTAHGIRFVTNSGTDRLGITANGGITASGSVGTIGQVLTSAGDAPPTWTTVSGGTGAPGGANTQLQYNNSGAFAGSANLTYDATTNTLALIGTDPTIDLNGITTEPTAPATGHVTIYAKSIAGRLQPKWVGPSGFDTPFQAAISQNKVAWWNPPGNATTVPGVLGIAAPTALGTATARNVATTNVFTRSKRLGYNSATTAGAAGGHYVTAAQYTTGAGSGLGGFYYVCRFGSADTLAQAIMFVGLSSTVAAPTVTASPATFTNSIGVGCATGDTNLSIYYGGSAAQTPIALGASFPAKTASTDLYELVLFCASNTATSVGYRVTNIGTGVQASGTLPAAVAGTQLPAATTFLAHRAYRSNNATATAVLIDVVSVYIETDT